MSDLSKQCRDLKELNPLAKTACELFLSECKKAGLNVLITETYRSQERQNYLYAQGREEPYKKNKEVTKTKSSKHTGRMAWDICKNVPGQEFTDIKFFEQCGAIAKRLGIEWGGDWTSFKDRPHFQINKNWKAPTLPKTTEGENMVKVESKKFIVDGHEINLNAINYGGKNYVELRDLVKLGLGVDYDSKRQLPIINTK